MSAGEKSFERCLVIGGSGMLGFEIVRQLKDQGKQVRVLDLQPLPEPICELVQGDIRRPEDLQAACRDVEVVFQTAAAVWDRSLPARVYEQVNVEGNQKVVDACLQLGIRRLVYTSTLDVVVEGSKSIVEGDESLPYPKRLPRDPYCRSKILAERLVLAANGPQLATWSWVCPCRGAGFPFSPPWSWPRSLNWWRPAPASAASP